MNCQLLIRGACSIALTGLFLASIPAASASTPPSESEDVAFFGDFHYGQESGLTLPAKAATVRMIYFRPKDRPFRAEVVDSMKVAILQIQAFFAQEIKRHGYGKLTFRFQTDDQGDPLVHRVVGEHADERYLEKSGAQQEIWRALGRFPIELIVLDLSADAVPFLAGPAAGVTFRAREGDRTFATVLVPSSFSFKTVAHELGHAFGLEHDFRDSDYVMAYGEPDQARLSACAAGYLAVNPYLNPGIGQEVSPSTIELLSPPGYPAGSRSTPVRLKISGSSGLHQVILFATTQTPHFAGGGAEVKACRTLSGERKAIVEFDYDGLIPSNTFSSLADPIVHRMRFWAVDTSGRTSQLFFSLYQLSEHHVATLQEIGNVKSLAFSPEGAALASAAGDSPIRLWHLGKRKILASFGPAPPVWAVGISPDGATLASEHNGTVRLWDLSTGTHTATLKGRPGDPRFSAVAFSPLDGATLAVASGDSTVSLWDLEKGANYVCHLKHDSGVTSVAFSPDGARLASASGDGTVHLWDPATGERTAVWEGHTGWVGALAFSPDAATLASKSGWDGLVKLWDVKTQGSIATMANTTGGSSMAFSPDGATLACASGEQVKLWDVGTRTQIESLSHGNRVEVVAFSPDGKTLAYGTWKAVELWDASEWGLYRILRKSAQGK